MQETNNGSFVNHDWPLPLVMSKSMQLVCIVGSTLDPFVEKGCVLYGLF